MNPRWNGQGRPSKGARQFIGVRLPRMLAEHVIQRAEESGMTITDYVGDILAEAHGMERVSKSSKHQSEELPLDETA